MTELLTPHQTAEKLHVVYGTLAAWRHNKRHPLSFVRIGRKIYYRPEDIEAYIAASVQPGDGPNRHVTMKEFKRKKAAR